MKKTVIFLVTTMFIFTLSSCSSMTTLEIPRDLLLQENEQVDDHQTVYTTIDNLLAKLDTILGREYADNYPYDDAREHNLAVLAAETLNISSIKQLSHIESVKGYYDSLMHSVMREVKATFEFNPDMVEGETTEIIGSDYTLYVNEDYIYKKKHHTSDSADETEIHRIVFEEDKYIHEKVVYRMINEQYFITHYMYDSKLGTTYTSVSENETDLYITFAEFDFTNETTLNLTTFIKDGVQTRVHYTSKDSINEIGFGFQIENQELLSKGFSILNDGVPSFSYTDYLSEDMVRLSYNLKDLDGWDNIKEDGYYNGDTKVYPFSGNMIPVEAITGSMNAYAEFTEELVETDLTNAIDNLTYSRTITLKDVEKKLKNCDDIINEYYQENSIRLFNKTFKSPEDLKNYILDFIPNEYLEEVGMR